MATVNFTTSYDAVNGNYVVTDLTPDPLNQNYYGNKLLEIFSGTGAILTKDFDRSQSVMNVPVGNWPATALIEIQVVLTYYYQDTTLNTASHIYAAPTTLNTKIQ